MNRDRVIILFFDHGVGWVHKVEDKLGSMSSCYSSEVSVYSCSTMQSVIRNFIEKDMFSMLATELLQQNYLHLTALNCMHLFSG